MGIGISPAGAPRPDTIWRNEPATTPSTPAPAPPPAIQTTTEAQPASAAHEDTWSSALASVSQLFTGLF